MSAKSHKYEKDVAKHINDSLDCVSAERPRVSTSYSDILVTHKDKNVWIEVKMNIHDNLINPRLSYTDGSWTASETYSSKATDILISHLNENLDADLWLKDLKLFTKKRKLSLHSTKRDRNSDPLSISAQTMSDFLKTRENKNICVIEDIDVAEIASLHYIHGKAARVDYLSIGDNFYKFSRKNPLNIPNIKKFGGKGVFTLRVGNNSKHDNYELQASLKIKGSIDQSDYSVMPGSLKLNPFHYMEL